MADEVKRDPYAFDSDNYETEWGDNSAEAQARQFEAIEERKEAYQNQISKEGVGRGHEKPKAHPEKGTLSQETVDATIGTLRKMITHLQSIRKILKLEELKKLSESVDKVKQSTLSKDPKSLVKKFTTSKLTEEDAKILCEDETMRQILDSNEMADVTANLQSVNLDEVQKLLSSTQVYINDHLSGIIEDCLGAINSNGKNNFDKKLEEICRLV